MPVVATTVAAEGEDVPVVVTSPAEAADQVVATLAVEVATLAGRAQVAATSVAISAVVAATSVVRVQAVATLVAVIVVRILAARGLEALIWGVAAELARGELAVVRDWENLNWAAAEARNGQAVRDWVISNSPAAEQEALAVKPRRNSVASAILVRAKRENVPVGSNWETFSVYRLMVD